MFPAAYKFRGKNLWVCNVLLTWTVVRTREDTRLPAAPLHRKAWSVVKPQATDSSRNKFRNESLSRAYFNASCSKLTLILRRRAGITDSANDFPGKGFRRGGVLCTIPG